MIWLELTSDLNRVYPILTDPEMFERITDDGASTDDFDLSLLSAFYFLCINEEKETVGVFVIRRQTNSCLDVHIHILKQYRARYARECGIEFIKWFAFEAPAHVVKCVTSAPEVMKDVRRFTVNHGFEYEGTNKQSIMKNGQLIDQIYYGLTRDKAKDIANKGAA